jgi:hypothetical protein
MIQASVISTMIFFSAALSEKSSPACVSEKQSRLTLSLDPGNQISDLQRFWSGKGDLQLCILTISCVTCHIVDLYPTQPRDLPVLHPVNVSVRAFLP